MKIYANRTSREITDFIDTDTWVKAYFHGDLGPFYVYIYTDRYGAVRGKCIEARYIDGYAAEDVLSGEYVDDGEPSTRIRDVGFQPKNWVTTLPLDTISNAEMTEVLRVNDSIYHQTLSEAGYYDDEYMEDEDE